jgi:long-chain acyl-CoA synthetase
MDDTVADRSPFKFARPWVAEYPAGVPAEAQIDPHLTLVDVLEAAFRQYAQRDACVCMGQRLSFADLDRLSQDLGAWLQQRGLERGARVALMMPNLPQYSVAIAAVLRAGYAVVNVNPLYTPRELEHQLNDSGAQAIVVLENFATTLGEVIEPACAMWCSQAWVICWVSGRAASSTSRSGI